MASEGDENSNSSIGIINKERGLVVDSWMFSLWALVDELDIRAVIVVSKGRNSWIRGTFTSSMASILVNGSPTSEFPLCCGLKQGDPLAPYLFILIMESLHISFSRVVNDGLFNGFQLHGSVNISHHFFADDALFIRRVGLKDQPLCLRIQVLGCQGFLFMLFLHAASIGFVSGCGASFLAMAALPPQHRRGLKFLQAIYVKVDSSCDSDTRHDLVPTLREVKSLKDSGFDFFALSKKRIGIGSCTRRRLWWLIIGRLHRSQLLLSGRAVMELSG
ncbi:RNA-directed DNA polymerase, eukaryota [Tanacetum coccineum]